MSIQIKQTKSSARRITLEQTQMRIFISFRHNYKVTMTVVRSNSLKIRACQTAIK